MKHLILYVDDEEVNLRIFKNTFRREFNVLTASSVLKGTEMLENNKVDVVITDQRMPGKTGVEFLKEINDRFPHIPPNRLMVSGYAKPKDIEKAFSHYHLFKFISKPWKEEET